MSLVKTLCKILGLKIDCNEHTFTSDFFLKKHNIECLLVTKENKSIPLDILSKRHFINYYNDLIFKKHQNYKIL